MKNTLIARTLCWLTLAVTQSAWAGMPYLSDDPEVTPYKDLAFYFYSQFDYAATQTAIIAPAFELDYGVVPNVQLHLQVLMLGNIVRSTINTGPSEPEDNNDEEFLPNTYGISDIEAGVSYRFIQESNYMPAVAFYPLIELPTGSFERNLGNGRTWFKLPLWLEKHFGPWTVDGGGGLIVGSMQGSKNFPYGGLVVQRNFGEKLSLGAEIYSQANDLINNQASTVINLGATYTIKKNFDILFSAGSNIAGARNTIAYLGLYWLLE